MAGLRSTNPCEAVEALSRADFPEAIKLLEKLVGEESGEGEAWLHPDVCYPETQQPKLAVEALEHAVRTWPQTLELSPDYDLTSFGCVRLHGLKAPCEDESDLTGGGARREPRRHPRRSFSRA